MLNSCSYKNETVCVIGGGWYGCHMAATLSNLGYDVELLEKNNVLFGESSSKNQCRLHRGLHYVRSWNTRKECMEGYTQLTKRYPMCVSPVEKNYYVVSQKSPIDFNTILDILTASNIPHTRVKPVDGQLSSFQGVIECDEQMFDHTLGAEHFANLLGGMVQYGVHVDDVVSDGDKVCVKTNNGKKEYGFAIDCTYNALGKAQKFIPCFYEPCLTLLYK